MALTVKVTAIGGLLAAVPPITLIFAEYVPAARPVGSAVTVTAEGVLAVTPCPLTLSHGEAGGATSMNGIDTPVLLVIFTVWVTAGPPN
jgi:hypothetical protein